MISTSVRFLNDLIGAEQVVVSIFFSVMEDKIGQGRKDASRAVYLCFL